MSSSSFNCFLHDSSAIELSWCPTSLSLFFSAFCVMLGMFKAARILLMCVSQKPPCIIHTIVKFVVLQHNFLGYNC